MKILYILLISGCISICFAIKCWVCRSDADPRCGDPFDNTSLPIYDCKMEKLDTYPGLKATMCRKIRQKVYGEWRYIRSCAFLGRPGEGTGDENNCLIRTGTYDVYAEYCTCDSKDGCNVAALPQTGTLTVIGLVVTSLWLALH